MTLTLKDLLKLKEAQKQFKTGVRVSPPVQTNLLQFEANRLKNVAHAEGLGKKNGAKSPTESHLQQRGVEWARYKMKRFGYPPEMLYAVPNGVNVSEQHRGRLVREGMMAGWPDLNLDIPSNGYHGLRIEVKRPGGRLSDKQRYMARLIGRQGYMWTTVYSDQEIVDAVSQYLGLSY